ncbi:MAG: hypothetical protein ACI9AR_000562 [Flavobacteriaceae bacterium]|jgi:hypothetical protein
MDIAQFLQTVPDTISQIGWIAFSILLVIDIVLWRFSPLLGFIGFVILVLFLGGII